MISESYHGSQLMDKTSEASMGPRSNDLGKHTRRYGTQISPSVLQWGRDRMISESDGSVVVIAELDGASMGPRSNDLGKPVGPLP